MIDEQSEKEFNEWIESIRFADDTELLDIELTKDTSDDPEGDREA